MLSAVVLVGCLCLITAAQSDISFGAGTASANYALQSWCESNIPTVYRSASALTVYELDQADMLTYLTNKDSLTAHSHRPSSIRDVDDIDGAFDDNPPRIAILVETDGSADTFTFAHEYGHYVWYDLLSKGERREYSKIYARTKSNGHLVTGYAAENVEEGYAEAFSMYVNLPQVLQRRDPDSYKFLSECKDRSGN